MLPEKHWLEGIGKASLQFRLYVLLEIFPLDSLGEIALLS
jgi:hypothetical protein